MIFYAIVISQNFFSIIFSDILDSGINVLSRLLALRNFSRGHRPYFIDKAVNCSEKNQFSRKNQFFIKIRAILCVLYYKYCSIISTVCQFSSKFLLNVPYDLKVRRLYCLISLLLCSSYETYCLKLSYHTISKTRV